MLTQSKYCERQTAYYTIYVENKFQRKKENKHKHNRWLVSVKFNQFLIQQNCCESQMWLGVSKPIINSLLLWWGIFILQCGYYDCSGYEYNEL